jgi:hypothetical protein
MGIGPELTQEGQRIGKMFDHMGGQDQIELLGPEAYIFTVEGDDLEAIVLAGIGCLVRIGLHRPDLGAQAFQLTADQTQATADLQDAATGLED